jgi:hypothetical protein
MSNANQKQPSQPSALGNIINAGAAGMASPSAAAQIAGAMSRPGTEGVVAQGAQAAWNMGVAGSREMMAGTIRQHGRSPSAVLQDLKTQQAIGSQKSNEKQSSQNKGVER